MKHILGSLLLIGCVSTPPVITNCGRILDELTEFGEITSVARVNVGDNMFNEKYVIRFSWQHYTRLYILHTNIPEQLQFIENESMLTGIQQGICLDSRDGLVTGEAVFIYGSERK